MTNDFEFQKKVVQVLSWISAAITSRRLYLSHSPYLAENIDKAYKGLLDLMSSDESLTIFLVGEELVVNRRRLMNVSPATQKISSILRQRGIESLTIASALQKEEFDQFLHDLSCSDLPAIASRKNIKLGKVELRKMDNEGLSQETDSTDSTSLENPSGGQSIRKPVLLTGEEPHALEEQYRMIHHEKKIDIHSINQIVDRFFHELERNLCPIYLLGSVKSFHEYTYTHLINVGILTMSLAAELGFEGVQLHDIGIAALLHDVGKTFIPDEILNKPGVLSLEERKIIEAHPVKGCLYLMELAEIPKIAILSALEHHLKFDGTGYPAIRPGWKPSMVAQMITVADVFDALRSRRSYKEPKPLSVVAEILRKESGTTFNPALVNAFLKMITEKDPPPVKEIPVDPISVSVNHQGNGLTGLPSNPIPVLDNSADNLSLRANEQEKKTQAMEKSDQIVEPQAGENSQEATVADLYRLIVTHAKAKDFLKAESLRDKLMDLDPMALNEIITSAEIIEQEKKDGMSMEHLSVFSDLYQAISKEEANALYYALKDAVFSNDQFLFSQGERNSNLYFIMQGQLKMLCTLGGKEVLLQTLQPGDILGIDTFFSDCLCTTSVLPFSRTKVNYLEKHVLQQWHEKFPSLETKLSRYCLKFQKTHDLLKNKGLDRRLQRRFRVEGNVRLQIVNASGSPIGNPFRGIVSDISASGLACQVKLPKKEIGQLLLGRHIELNVSLSVKSTGRSFIRIGTIVAVSSPPFDDYYLHIRFHQVLDNALVRELAAAHAAGAA